MKQRLKNMWPPFRSLFLAHTAAHFTAIALWTVLFLLYPIGEFTAQAFIATQAWHSPVIFLLSVAAAVEVLRRSTRWKGASEPYRLLAGFATTVPVLYLFVTFYYAVVNGIINEAVHGAGVARLALIGGALVTNILVFMAVLAAINLALIGIGRVVARLMKR